METAKIIGVNIKSYRQKFGYTQDQLANFLGVDRTTLSKYENGEREITILHLDKLADVFGIEIDDLIEPDSILKTANLAFAFRNQEIEPQDLISIASFQRVVKNYLKMVQIANEKE